MNKYESYLKAQVKIKNPNLFAPGDWVRLTVHHTDRTHVSYGEITARANQYVENGETLEVNDRVFRPDGTRAPHRTRCTIEHAERPHE